MENEHNEQGLNLTLQRPPVAPAAGVLKQLSTIIEQCLYDRRVLGDQEKDTVPLVNAYIKEIEGFRSRFDHAVETSDLFVAISSFLELKRFIRLIEVDESYLKRSGLPLYSDTESPSAEHYSTFALLDTLSRWRLDIIVENGIAERDNLTSEFPQLLAFVEELRSAYGRAGLDVMQLCLRSFLERYCYPGIVRIFRIRGYTAGCNDIFNPDSFCNQVARFAMWLSCYLQDVDEFIGLARSAPSFVEVRSLHAIGRGLLDAGSASEALRWLNAGKALNYSCRIESHDLRIAAAAAMGNPDVAQSQLTAAFLETADQRYLNRLLEAVSDENTCMTTRACLLGAVQQTGDVTSVFRLLVQMESWADAEAFYRCSLTHEDGVLILVFGDIDRAIQLSQTIRHALPEVACGLLRFAARQLLRANKKYDRTLQLLRESFVLCPNPQYHPAHISFLDELANEFSSRRLLRKWLEGQRRSFEERPSRHTDS